MEASMKQLCFNFRDKQNSIPTISLSQEKHDTLIKLMAKIIISIQNNSQKEDNKIHDKI